MGVIVPSVLRKGVFDLSDEELPLRVDGAGMGRDECEKDGVE